MPRFSICVPTYNDAAYLTDCLTSALSQERVDLELIVVNDGSTDDTSKILRALAASDPRIIAIDRAQNKGLHLSRAEALDHATGEYTIFLDSDDELIEGFLFKLDRCLTANPVDALHFGIEVVDAGVGKAEARQFEEYINAGLEPLYGEGILRAIFSPFTGGYCQDWRFTQRAFKTSLLKHAWSLMPKMDLGRAEDACESFVLLSKAATSITRNDIVGLRYFYGRGVNSSHELTPAEFAEDSREFWGSIEAIRTYAEGMASPHAHECYLGAREKLFDLLFNDWHARVPASSKVEALSLAAEATSAVDCATQVMRIVRDETYRAIAHSAYDSVDEDCLTWYDHARALAGREGMRFARYRSYHHSATSYMKSLQAARALRWHADQLARIFVSTHKPVALFDSKILQPVQVGCALRDFRFPWALHDDEGDAISQLNAMYCELTTQYWAWKNVDAPYIGFCHYRRYFDFSPTAHPENIYGEVMAEGIDAESQVEYHLHDDQIMQALEGADIVTTVVQDIRSYLGPNATLRSQYDAADQLHVEDLDLAVKIMVRQHPEYALDAREFLDGHHACFCNMFIMRRDLFRDYCAWLFPVLDEFMRQADMGSYSREGLRTPGHLAERLLNIYLMHLARIAPDIKIDRVQCVHFMHPEPHFEQVPAFDAREVRPIIPVVLASDDNYVPMLTTTIHSMLENASDRYCYDVVVLHRDISDANRQTVRRFVAQHAGAQVRFINVSRIVNTFDLATNNPHISIETYYRFLIQELLPEYDKVLYLDSDLIVIDDISKLYEVELGDSLLAAVPDIDFAGNVNKKDGARRRYAHEILGMSDPFAYFQAGVLVFNTQGMRARYSIEQWLEYASDDRFIYNDQDVLNAHCEGAVTYLDYSWNVMIECGGRIGDVFAYAPASMFDAYQESRAHEKIVHYAGVDKPWKNLACDRSALYWEYARQTPYHEHLLGHLSGSAQPRVEADTRHYPAVSKNSPLRRVFDPVAPIGSRRREVGKSLIRAMRGIQ